MKRHFETLKLVWYYKDGNHFVIRILQQNKINKIKINKNLIKSKNTNINLPIFISLDLTSHLASYKQKTNKNSSKCVQRRRLHNTPEHFFRGLNKLMPQLFIPDDITRTGHLFQQLIKPP